MSEEKKFQDDLMAAIKRARGHASNVESGLTSAGIPDVDYCIDGVEGKVELKHYRKSKPAHRDAPEIKASQIKWMRNRIKAGGRPLLLSVIRLRGHEGGEGLIMHRGEHIEALSKMKSSQEWIDLPCLVWLGVINWEGVISFLKQPELVP